MAVVIFICENNKKTNNRNMKIVQVCVRVCFRVHTAQIYLNTYHKNNNDNARKFHFNIEVKL